MLRNKSVSSPQYTSAVSLYGADVSEADKLILAEGDIKKLLLLIQKRPTLLAKLKLLYIVIYQQIENFIKQFPTHTLPSDFISDMRQRILEAIALIDKDPQTSQNDVDLFMKRFSSLLYLLTPFSVEYRGNKLKSNVYELAIHFIEAQLCADEKSVPVKTPAVPNRAVEFVEDFTKYFDLDTRLYGLSDLAKLLANIKKFIQQNPSVKLDSVMRYDQVRLLGNASDSDFKLISSPIERDDSYQMQVFKLCHQLKSEKDSELRNILVVKQTYFFFRLQYYLKLCLIFEARVIEVVKTEPMVFSNERTLFGKVRDDVLPKAMAQIPEFSKHILDEKSHLFTKGFDVLGRVCLLPGSEDNRFYLYDENTLKIKYMAMEKDLLEMLTGKTKGVPIKFQIDILQYFLIGQMYERSKVHTNHASRIQFVLKVLSELYKLVDKTSIETAYERINEYLVKVAKISEEIRIEGDKFVAKGSGKSLKGLCDICNSLGRILKPVVKFAGNPVTLHPAQPTATVTAAIAAAPAASSGHIDSPRAKK